MERIHYKSQFHLDYSLIAVLQYENRVQDKIKINFDRAQRRYLINILGVYGSKCRSKISANKRLFRTMDSIERARLINIKHYYGEEEYRKESKITKDGKNYYDNLIKKIKRSRPLTCEEFQLLCHRIIFMNKTNIDNPTQIEKSVFAIIAEAGKILFNITGLNHEELAKWVSTRAQKRLHIIENKQEESKAKMARKLSSNDDMEVIKKSQYYLECLLILIFGFIEEVPSGIRFKFNKYQQDRIVKALKLYGSKYDGENKNKYNQIEEIGNPEQEEKRTFYNTIIKRIKNNEPLTCKQFQSLCTIFLGSINKDQPTPNEAGIIHQMAGAGKTLFDLAELNDDQLEKWAKDNAKVVDEYLQRVSMDTFREVMEEKMETIINHQLRGSTEE